MVAQHQVNAACASLIDVIKAINGNITIYEIKLIDPIHKNTEAGIESDTWNKKLKMDNVNNDKF